LSDSENVLFNDFLVHLIIMVEKLVHVEMVLGKRLPDMCDVEDS
jgi:hypothetical protein